MKAKPQDIDLFKLYADLLGCQTFNIDLLDYTIAERHMTILKTLAAIGNSGVSIFDHYKKDHIYFSENFCRFLGYNYEMLNDENKNLIDSKIHPDDFKVLTQNGISLLKLFYQLPVEQKSAFKLINEFRILNTDNKYIRVIEQHQILELDTLGNIWLSLGIIDISPDQKSLGGVNSQLLNFRTGTVYPFAETLKIENEVQKPELTSREIQILNLVKEGYLSKEISSKLSISLHTVNTHRQKILEKLGVNNSIEAISYASGLGLV